VSHTVKGASERAGPMGSTPTRDFEWAVTKGFDPDLPRPRGRSLTCSSRTAPHVRGRQRTDTVLWVDGGGGIEL
jgi:hypothetical protein